MYSSYCYVFILMFSMFPLLSAGTLPEIVPSPQEISWTSEPETMADANIFTSISISDELQTPAWALGRLERALGRTLLQHKEGSIRLLKSSMPASIPARTRHEAYGLIVTTTGVTIHAETAHGLHNGLITLASLITRDKRIPCVSISDWPDQEIRGTCVSGIDLAEERFEQFIALKLNLLILEDGGLYDMDQSEKSARYVQFAEKCRACFVEFVPELQSLGWGHYVLQREPRAVEARWIERKSFPVLEGRVYSPDPPLPDAVEVINAQFDDGLNGWTAETYKTRWIPATVEEAAVVSPGPNDGTPLLQLSLNEPGTVRVSQELAVQPNARYTLKCTISTKGVIGTGAYFEVYGIDKKRYMTLIGPHQGAFCGDMERQEAQVVFNTGAYQRARPGGSLTDSPQVHDGFEKVCLYLRLQDSTGTAWFDSGEIAPEQSPNRLANSVVTDSAKVVVENEAGFLYEEGRDYLLEIPELRYPYAIGAPLQVILTDDSRIKNGDILFLSYNQAEMEDITCCPSEPLYDAFMRRSIGNVVKQLRPKYLHIGHDEPRFFNRDQRCADRSMSNEALLVDAIKRIRESALAADPFIRIMMWDDAINPYQNGPHLSTEKVAEYLPKDIIINIWWYDNFDLDRQLGDSTAYFMNQGFSVTGSPWFRIPNARRWTELFDGYKDNLKALGIIYTSWGEVPDPWGALEFTAEHSWSYGNPAFTDASRIP